MLTSIPPCSSVFVFSLQVLGQGGQETVLFGVGVGTGGGLPEREMETGMGADVIMGVGMGVGVLL